MKLRTIVRFGVIAVSFVLGASSVNVTAQELNRDAIYSRFEEYYPATPPEKIREILDGFAQHLKANPSLRALLISYGGKQSCHNEALLRARLATRYLLKVHKLPLSRATILDGGYRENGVVELWVGSPGAIPPTPTRTINRKEVIISGNCKFALLDASRARKGVEPY
jgi:hypothetical protein